MNVPNFLIQKAFYWKKNVHGVNIVPVFTHEGISDENLRLNIIRKEEARLRFYDARNNGTDKTWYDRSTNSLYVYLPNIANEQELDTLLLERVSALSGLSGLLGRDVTDGIGRQVFDNLRPDVQSKLSLSASGNALSGFERAYAGKKYLGDCVEHVTTAEDRKKAFNHWKFMFVRYIQVAKPGFWNSLSIDMNMKLNALASGLRGRFFQKSEKRQMEKEDASTEHVKERLVEWYDREHLTEEQASKLNNPLDKYIDRLDYIRIGYPSPVLLSAMADSRSALIQLPACGIYGHPGDDLGERYILPENGMKKDKHPFELTDLLTLKEELNAPLAVFRSRDPHKTSSSVVMLESMSSNPECPGTFCVALTPKEVNPVDNNGRDSMKGSGRWVNNIDSIYPRGDMSFIMFLKTPGLTTYLAPGFEEKWLKPAVQRMEAYYDKVFAASGMEKPTGELLELLVNGAVYEYWLTQEDIKNIDRSLVTSRERSGLLVEYATYHVAVESATNVVRKFENPKIIDKNVEFSIHGDDLTQRMTANYDEVAKWFSRLTLDDKCRFLGFADKNDAWKDLMEWHPLGGPDWKLDEGMLSDGIDNMFKQATAEEVIAKYVEWKNDGFKDSETYALATDMTMFMADNLNRVGIRTKVVSEEESKLILETERKNNIRQRLSVALRTMQPGGYSSPQIVNVGANLTKISDVANNLEILIKEIEAGRTLGNHEILYEIARCLGYEESKRSSGEQKNRRDENQISIYADFDNGIRLRLATHYANARNFELGNHPSHNMGIVVRIFKNRFLKDNDVSYIENIYFPDKLTGERKLELLRGVLSFIRTGDFLHLPVPDNMHTSPDFQLEKQLKQNNTHEFRLSNGTVYGYQLGDTIYLTPEGINPNTPIHEYAHLWAKVYEKLRPDEWELLKEELKALPQWKEIAESESYSFIESDENRLAGEVLATIVGNKGEELMLSAARDTLKEGERADESVVKGAEYFRRKVTDMAVKDVFDAEGLERTGEVTLKVLKDFAEGKGVKMSKEEGERLAAMAGTSSSGDKLVRVVDIMPDKSISGKSDILAKIPSGGIVVFNEESNAGVTVSRKAIRHSLQRLNETTIACAYNIEKIINNAKLLGNLPVAIDEIEHTRAVMVYYCPVRIGEELISARLLIKQLENNGRVIESLSFYNITPHKKREASPVPNVKGFPGVYSDDKLSSCKIKDIIHNTQDYDKILAGIETETSFHIDKDAISEFTYNNKPDMTNLDFVSYAASDISKAALFVAWETRDDNPYEFVANLSRAELEDFLKNSFDKLNVEDKDIVTNILNKAPGYDEDFVEKRINSEISLWFNNLSLEDKMRVFSFYHYTPGVEESPIGVLDNNDDVKVLNKTYEAAIGVPIDIPEVDESVVRASIEKMLVSAFESISDTSKAQVYRDVVASGIPANTLMTNATNIKIAFPERKEQLLALSPNDTGARMLEDMYEYNLLWDGINPRTPGKIQEEIAAAANEADEIIIVTPTSESLSRQITNLILKDKLHDGDKIFIRDERMSELKTMEISSVRKEPNVEYDLKYAECSLSVFLHDNGTIKSCVEHYGKDLLDNHVDGAAYHFAKSGMLLSAEKGNAVQSPVHAIEELQKMVQENIGKMNVLEIAGLRDLVAKLNEPLSYFRHEMSNGDHVIGVSTRSSIDDRMGAFKELQDTIERNYEKARSEFFEYAGRGFKANNNLWDRLMRRTFMPTYPLPPMDDLKIEGRQHKQGAVSLDEIETGKIPLDFYNRFLDRCLQPDGPDIDVNAMPKMSTMTEISKVPTGVITESEIAKIPANYREQLTLTGRIDGPVSATNGELVLVQKDNDTLVTLRPSDAREILMTLGGQERLKIDGREFQVSLDELKNLSFGVGQHLTPADGGEKAYVVFDIKQQRPVVATSFDSLLRKELRSAREEANKMALKEGLTQSQEQKNGKGRGGRS